jgi:hypothetical protein
LNSKAFLLPQALPGETSLVQVLSKRNLDVVFFEESLSDVRFFKEKWHSLSVAPKPLAVWNKKLEGLEHSGLKNLKIFPEDMYLAAPEPIFGFFV